MREPVAVDSVAEFVTESVKPPTDRRIHSVELVLPAPVLESGLVLVDTPGVGGLGSMHSTVTMGALPMAEAVLFVSDASQEFTQPEIDFMESARSMCPNIVVLLTKIDFYPAWRKVKALDEAHLERLGIETEIIPVSSTLHDHRPGDRRRGSRRGVRLPGHAGAPPDPHRGPGRDAERGQAVQ